MSNESKGRSTRLPRRQEPLLLIRPSEPEPEAENIDVISYAARHYRHTRWADNRKSAAVAGTHTLKPSLRYLPTTPPRNARVPGRALFVCGRPAHATFSPRPAAWPGLLPRCAGLTAILLASPAANEQDTCGPPRPGLFLPTVEQGGRCPRWPQIESSTWAFSTDSSGHPPRTSSPGGWWRPSGRRVRKTPPLRPRALPAGPGGRGKKPDEPDQRLHGVLCRPQGYGHSIPSADHVADCRRGGGRRTKEKAGTLSRCSRHDNSHAGLSGGQPCDLPL